MKNKILSRYYSFYLGTVVYTGSAPPGNSTYIATVQQFHNYYVNDRKKTKGSWYEVNAGPGPLTAM